MPETPDASPRHRWALDSAYGAVHRRRRPMLCDTSSLTASSVWVYLDANWSFYRRSEEHTSELQLHSFISYAVFCLKKKNILIQPTLRRPWNAHPPSRSSTSLC